MKLVDKYGKCKICGLSKALVQHHTGHRRYSNEVILICWECHAKVHANPEWAYNNGYLVKHNTFYKIDMKPIKTKSHVHGKTYGKAIDGELVNICQTCGNPVVNPNFGKITPRIANKVLKSTIKIGSVIADSRIKTAEELKKDFAENSLKKKGENSPNTRAK